MQPPPIAVSRKVMPSSALTRTSINSAGPSRCGAQCKTLARGPSKQWFCDVIVFSQPCYDRGRAQIYSKPLTPKLSTFANVREEIRKFWRARCLLTMKFIWLFYWILKRPRGAGPVRLHRLKAGPVDKKIKNSMMHCLPLTKLFSWHFAAIFNNKNFVVASLYWQSLSCTSLMKFAHVHIILWNRICTCNA